MPTVRVKENEPFEVAMRRFKRTVDRRAPSLARIAAFMSSVTLSLR